MRSIVILEVEHGENTDVLQEFANQITDEPDYFGNDSLLVKGYTVRVDLPECFRLET